MAPVVMSSNSFNATQQSMKVINMSEKYWSNLPAMTTFQPQFLDDEGVFVNAGMSFSNPSKAVAKCKELTNYNTRTRTRIEVVETTEYAEDNFSNMLAKYLNK